jgi:glycosyltransferase involved in cell wall biosynthesis
MEALADLSECQRRGDRAREYTLQHFSWDAIAQQTIAAYAGIVRR